MLQLKTYMGYGGQFYETVKWGFEVF